MLAIFCRSVWAALAAVWGRAHKALGPLRFRVVELTQADGWFSVEEETAATHYRRPAGICDGSEERRLAFDSDRDGRRGRPKFGPAEVF